MMVYPEEPSSVWAIPRIPALYDDDGDYGGKQTSPNSLSDDEWKWTNSNLESREQLIRFQFHWWMIWMENL